MAPNPQTDREEAAGGLMAADYFTGLVDEASCRVLGYFGTRLKWIRAFTMGSGVQAAAEDMSGVEDVGQVRKTLSESAVIMPAREVKLTGTFFPALLLYKGW